MYKTIIAALPTEYRHIWKVILKRQHIIIVNSAYTYDSDTIFIRCPE